MSPTSIMAAPQSLTLMETADDFSSVLYWAIFNLCGL